MKGQALHSFVDSTFDIIRDRCTREELVFVCPQPGCPDSTGNRSVNLKTGKTSCWRCQVGGDFVFWVKKLGYEIEDQPISMRPASELDSVLMERKEKEIIPIISGISLPQGFTSVKDNLSSAFTRAIERMAKSKNLELDDMIKAGVGFSVMNHEWEPYAIFPVVEWGRVVYYQGRLHRRDTNLKGKKFPSRSSVPLGAKYWVYNFDAIRARKPDTVVVVESILNVLSLEKRFIELNEPAVAVCVFKHAMSHPQRVKLIRSGVKEICYMYDVDAISNAWKQARFTSDHLLTTVAELDPKKSLKLDLSRPEDQEKAKKWDANDDVDCALIAYHDRKRFKVTSALEAQLSEFL